MDYKQELIDRTQRHFVRFVVLTMAYCVIAVVVLTTCSLPFLVRLRELFQGDDGVKRLPLDKLLAAHPNLIGWTLAIGAAGILLSLVGVAVIRWAVGKPRRLPLLLTLVPYPFLLIFTAYGVIQIAVQFPAAALLLSGPMIALSSFVVLPWLMVVHGQKLWQAVRSARTQWNAVPIEKLPAAPRAYFDTLQTRLSDYGYTHVSDQQYSTRNGFFRRLWANSSRTIYASATWVASGRNVGYAFSATSLAENGAYLETTNLASDSFTTPAEGDHSFVKISHATPAEVIEAHEQRLVEWMHKHDALPMQIELRDEPQLCDYGRCCLAKAKRDESIFHRMIWLSTAFCEADVPTPPGRPWIPSQDAVLEPV